MSSDPQESLNTLQNENIIILKRSLFLFPKSKLQKIRTLAEGLEKSEPRRSCGPLPCGTAPPCGRRTERVMRSTPAQGSDGVKFV